jgi:hypothetical protein
MTVSITAIYRFAQCRFAECRPLFILILNVIIPSVVVPKSVAPLLTIRTNIKLGWRDSPATNTLAKYQHL